jgi:hypothetical protein
VSKSKLERIISLIREQMVVGAGGFTGSGDQTRSGFDPVQKEVMRRNSPVYAKGGRGSRKRWLDYLKSSNGRRN